MKEEELPVLEDRHLAQELQEARFLLFCHSGIRYFPEGGLLRRRSDDEDFFAFADATEIFLRVFVFVLERIHVLQFPSRIFVAACHRGILFPHVAECAIKEDVSVKGKRQTECHESYDRKADDDGELPTEGFTGVKSHEGN